MHTFEVLQKMPVFQSESQGGGAGLKVLNHYRAEKNAPGYQKESRASMRALIEKLNTEFKETNIWLLTSHFSLLLMSGPRYTDGSHVTISALETNFTISYYIPEREAPFRGAIVQGEAGGLDEAFRYSLISMKNSEGWPNSEELIGKVELYVR